MHQSDLSFLPPLQKWFVTFMKVFNEALKVSFFTFSTFTGKQVSSLLGCLSETVKIYSECYLKHKIKSHRARGWRSDRRASADSVALLLHFKETDFPTAKKATGMIYRTEDPIKNLVHHIHTKFPIPEPKSGGEGLFNGVTCKQVEDISFPFAPMNIKRFWCIGITY